MADALGHVQRRESRRRAPDRLSSGGLSRRSGPVREHLRKARAPGNPCDRGRADPSADQQHVLPPLGEREVVDRLVVRDSVAKAVEPLQAVVDLGTDFGAQMRESVAQRRSPKRRGVPRVQREAPEAEHQLGNDLAMPVPTQDLAMVGLQLQVERIAQHDLKLAQRPLQRGRDLAVPLIEGERCSRVARCGGDVLVEPGRREARSKQCYVWKLGRDLGMLTSIAQTPERSLPTVRGEANRRGFAVLWARQLRRGPTGADMASWW